MIRVSRRFAAERVEHPVAAFKAPLFTRSITLYEIFVRVALMELDHPHFFWGFIPNYQIGQPLGDEGFFRPREALQGQYFSCVPERR